jgi:hypothetical protein
MIYKELINLGFVRDDFDDPVEIDNSGYPGFSLKLELYGRMAVECVYPDIHKLILYIPKTGQDNYHSISINDEILKDLIELFKLSKK